MTSRRPDPIDLLLPPSVAAAAPTRGAGLRRLALLAAGWTIVALGIALAPLPGPFGLPVAAVGGMLVLRNSHDARKRFVRAKRRAPAMLAPLVARFEGWRRRRRARRLSDARA
ncbi:MAG TPA: hypothetical protein VEB20_14580 [Azospirillaceae bacterium]|nr:hypothetical protein [Azospirillaceae bacterium]